MYAWTYVANFNQWMQENEPGWMPVYTFIRTLQIVVAVF